MKRFLLVALTFVGGLHALPSILNARLAGMGGVSVSIPLGNSFTLNPAVVDLQSPIVLGSDIGLAEGGSSDLQDVQGRLFFTKAFPGNVAKGLPDMGLGLALNYAGAIYSGAFPDAQGVLWSESRLDSAFRVKWGPLSVGVGVAGTVSGTGVSVNGENLPAVWGVDMSLGAFLGLANIGPGHLGVGVSALHLLTDATNGSRQEVRFGLSYQVPRFLLALESSLATEDGGNIDLLLGTRWSAIPDRLSLQGGVQWLGMSSFEPTVGAALRLGALQLVYAFGFNLTTGGIGQHRLGLEVAFP